MAIFSMFKVNVLIRFNRLIQPQNRFFGQTRKSFFLAMILKCFGGNRSFPFSALKETNTCCSLFGNFSGPHSADGSIIVAPGPNLGAPRIVQNKAFSKVVNEKNTVENIGQHCAPKIISTECKNDY